MQNTKKRMQLAICIVDIQLLEKLLSTRLTLVFNFKKMKKKIIIIMLIIILYEILSQVQDVQFSHVSTDKLD